jgi:hypothetical protein
VAAVVAGVAIAAGGATILVPKDTEDRATPGAAANLWVEPGAGECDRSATPVPYAASKAPDARCGSLDQAYDAANTTAAASTILMRGTFPYDGDNVNQEITGDRRATGRITFDCAPGERCVFEGAVQFGDGKMVGREFPGGPDRVTFKNARTSTFAEAAGPSRYQHDDNRFGTFFLGGTSHVRMEDVRQGGFLMQGVRDVEWTGGESGPCMAPSLPDYNPAPIKTNPCELNKMDFACDQGADLCQTRHVTIDGITVSGYAYDQHCATQAESGPDGCHHRNWYMNGVKDVTIRNSTFRQSVFEPWSTISGPDAGATGNEGILWENNQFGSSVFYGRGDFAASPTIGLGGGGACWSSSQPAYRDVTIRFNSFARFNGLAVPGNIAPADDDATDEICTVSGYRVYGNIFGTRPVGDDACGNRGNAIQYRYNVYAGDVPGTCSGIGETNIGDTDMAFYADPDWAPEPGDYAVTGRPTAADDLVPADNPRFPCPATDADGTPRPSGPGEFCDAGAFER